MGFSNNSSTNASSSSFDSNFENDPLDADQLHPPSTRPPLGVAGKKEPPREYEVQSNGREYGGVKKTARPRNANQANPVRQGSKMHDSDSDDDDDDYDDCAKELGDGLFNEEVERMINGKNRKSKKRTSRHKAISKV